MLWETGTSTTRSSPYSTFSVKAMYFQPLKLVSEKVGPPLSQLPLALGINTGIVFSCATQLVYRKPGLGRRRAVMGMRKQKRRRKRR